MKYTSWTGLVFEALARTWDGRYGGVGLPAVAAALGFEVLTWANFTKREGIPNALMSAMHDLEHLGLVTFENIDWGNELTPLGRDVADSGLASIWPQLARIHLSAREASFLSKVYEASAVEQEGWADLLFVDADEVAGLIGLDTGEHADLIRRGTFIGDLERKGLLQAEPRFGGGPTIARPTYVAAVRLTETVEGGSSRVAGSRDASTSAPGSDLKPGARRPRGRPKGTRYLSDPQEVIEAYRKARLLQPRNPSATPSQEVVAKQLKVSRGALADFLAAEGMPWPPE